MYSRYLAYNGIASEVIPHYEHWSCPDAETFITDIDHYKQPKSCRDKLNSLYPQLGLPPYPDDSPIPRPELSDSDESSSVQNSNGQHAVRWGDSQSWHWDWGKNLKSAEDVFRFSPLEQGDFRQIPVVESFDYRDEDGLYDLFRARFPATWGDSPPEGSDASWGFYNTMFMWPLLTFGWELFLETCLDPRFERIMDEFAEINRRVFRAAARLPVNYVICHDDIVTSRGPTCSPEWMHKYIFPRYEEFWAILRDSGKRVIFMVDGNMDAYVDDVFACGACGIITEPYTDFRAIARKHENCVIAGEGDVRILMRNDPAEIEQMVRHMVETAQMTGGYLMCIGNHIPWNTPPAAVKCYLDWSHELGRR